MKRYLYIIGISIIVVLIAIWLFLLFASDETKADVYNRFGFTGTEEEGIFEEVIDTLIPDVFQKQYLRQLTTKRVIGYTEVATASSTLVYFVEGGTGHVYTIDPMIEGSENRISNITIPTATEAALSPDGSVIVIKSGNKVESQLTILKKNGETMDSFTTDESVRDFSASANNNVLYTTTSGAGLYGKEFDTTSKTAKTIFEIPFKEATVEWGTASNDLHYVYPKASHHMEGYLYKIQDGKFLRTPAAGFSLMAEGNNQKVLYSRISNTVSNSYVLDLASGAVKQTPTTFIPEKCSLESDVAYCAFGQNNYEYDFPDNWYRGEVSFSDDIWQVNMNTLESGFIVNTMAESGRELDIIDLSAGKDARLLYFINKKDHTLWTYEFPETSNSSQ